MEVQVRAELGRAQRSFAAHPRCERHLATLYASNPRLVSAELLQGLYRVLLAPRCTSAARFLSFIGGLFNRIDNGRLATTVLTLLADLSSSASPLVRSRATHLLGTILIGSGDAEFDESVFDVIEPAMLLRAKVVAVHFFMRKSGLLQIFYTKTVHIFLTLLFRIELHLCVRRPCAH